MQVWIESLSMQNPSVAKLWWFLPFGYMLTVLVESPILWIFLPKLSFKQKLWYGLWLTACTYPVVILVLPALMTDFTRGAYLLIAEIFAPVTECLVFWISTRETQSFEKRDWVISFIAITAANVISFIVGELLWLT